MDFLFFGLLGAIGASFMGVVAMRLYTGVSWSSGRSQCDACGRPLPPSMLVPVFSYLLSAGRARCCGVRLSFFSPASELVLGVLFVAAYLVLGLSYELVVVLLALTLLYGLVAYDLAHQILPSPLLFPFVGVSAIAGFLAAGSWAAFAEHLLPAVFIGAFLALVHVLSQGRAMGLADAPLAFGLALLAGPFAFSGFVYSFWIGAAIGIVVLLSRPKGSRMGVEVPFAPYLAAGFLLAYFTQWNILDIIAFALF